VTVAPTESGNGLPIAEVNADSEAAARGISEDDRIVSINHSEVTSADDAKNILAKAWKSDRAHAVFQIDGEQGSRFAALPIEQG